MPVRIIPNTVDVHVRYFPTSEQNCENVFQYSYENPPPTSGELLSLATAVASTTADKMRDMMSNLITFREVYAVDIGAIGRAEATYQFPANSYGRRTGPRLAMNEAANCALRTGLTGRRRKGRKSFSGFVEADMDQDTLGTALITLLLQVFVEMLLQRVSGRFQPVVASLVGQHTTPLNSVILPNNSTDSQKTRLLDRGR